MRRGEIWTAAGGDAYLGKPRPVLVVQDDAFEETDSIPICLITSQALDAGIVRVPLAPTAANGLQTPSWVMADKISTVPRIRLRGRIGTASPAAMRAVSRALIVFLGLTA